MALPRYSWPPVVSMLAREIIRVAQGTRSAKAADREGVHARAFAIAVRLLAGETLELDDEHGRHWRATARALSWVLAGEAAPVVEGCAGDAAPHRGLR